MKLASTFKASLLALGLVTLFSSCAEDNLSDIGESIQPGRDKVTGRATKLTFEATTVATPTLYTDGTTSLLGTLHDELDANVTGEFVKQVRTAEGLTFEGAGNDQLTIDSVNFRIYSDRTEGDAAAQIKVNVYELAQPLTTAGTTSQSLAQYREGATLLGAATLQPKAGQLVAQNSPLRYFTIPLDVALGKRIYEASISPTRKEAFSTQERFDREILHGFYVAPVTGRGFLLEVTEVALMIHYSIPNPQKPTERIKYTKAFVDTKLTTRRNALSSGDVSTLTAPSAEYSYVKSPAGVTTEYTLSVAELQKLLKTVPTPSKTPAADFIGRSWMLADANFSVPVKMQEGQRTNQPDYLLLLPADKVQEYFKAEVQTMESGKSYISKKYTASDKAYHFNNIARIVTEHLAKHATYSAATGWTITTPLQLRLVPVSLTTMNGTSALIAELIRPSFIRLSKTAKDLQVSFVSVELQQQ
ncbi:DUF4270 family protein [Porphyromonas sp.]